MKTLVAFLVAALCRGAVVSVCTSGCTTNSLQIALDSSANCGDTIQIKSTETQSGNFTLTYRGCAGNPITVTTDRAEWLPAPEARITPSHLVNMAKITTPNGLPAIRDALDGLGRPPDGWRFVGVAFTSTGTSGSFNLVQFNWHGATNASQLANDVTFDRCYFYMPAIYTGQNLQNAIRGDAANLTVKNSFFGDGFWNEFIESHAISILTNPGPVTITNNFFTTSSIPIFSGGGTPTFPTYLDNGIAARFNYFWRPWKYNGDPDQPHADDYKAWAGSRPRSGPHTIVGVNAFGVVTVAEGGPFFQGSIINIVGVGGCTAANGTGWRIDALSPTSFGLRNFAGCNAPYTTGGTVHSFDIRVCQKNLGEFKYGDHILWQYNVGENSPYRYILGCGSQHNGFTDTFRTEWNTDLGNPNLGAFSFTDESHLTWTGSYQIGNTGSGASSSFVDDLGICISMPMTGLECHPIASYEPGSLTVSEPFSAAPQGAQHGWISYTGSATLNDVVIRDNVFRNVDRGLTVLACSFRGGAYCSADHQVINNLWFISDPYFTGRSGFDFAAAEADAPQGPTGYRFDHNTVYSPFGFTNRPFIYFNAMGCVACATSLQPKFENSALTSNLFGESAGGAGFTPFRGDSYSGISDVTNFYLTNSSVKNNGLPGATLGSGCTGGNTCSGNLTAAWADPYNRLAPRGLFKIAPDSQYARAGADGRDIGVDFDRLPQITNLKVTAGPAAAMLEFDLTEPIGDAGVTQPCILEVSTNRNLHSDLGTYTVINELNPGFFRQGDTSARTNPALLSVVVSGRHVYWPIGRNATVAGDDGGGYDLALSPGTIYYGRLMCYGDAKWFTFRAESGAPSSTQQATSATLQTGTTPGTTSVRLQFGATPALGNAADFAPDGNGRARIALPLESGRPTYYRVQYLNGMNVTYTGPVAALLGGT